MANNLGKQLSNDQLALLTKVARLYYQQNYKQPQIAKRLGISQSRVSRLLTEAQELGVVRISIVSPDLVYPELEDALREGLGLRDVIVAHCDDDSEEATLSAIGNAGANYLETTLRGRDRIGLSSWSASLLAVVEAMSARNAKAIEIVQMQGGVGNPKAQVLATRLTDRFARVTNADVRYLSAPGLVANAQVRDGLLSDPFLSEVAKAWSKLTIALVGIGALQPSPLLRDSGNTIADEDLENLRKQGAVGDICLHFFDQNGQPVSDHLEERLVGIAAETLMGVERRVGVAGGVRKVEAIYAAAKGGWIDVLVTDSNTARALVAKLN